MPVTSTTPVKSHTGNAVTTVFAYDFRILATADLNVTVDGVTKTLTTDYSVSGVGDSGGGNVTFVVAPANGAAIVLQRNASYDRTGVDYQRGGAFDEETVDKDFDRAVMLIQQIKAILDRVPQIKAGLTLTQPSLPDPVSQRFLRWKSDLSGLENLDIATIGALAVSDFMKTVLDDADAAAARATIGLGTAALKNTGTSGDAVPLLNANALHTGHETFQGRLNVASVVGGTVDAITATFDPPFTAWVDKMRFAFRATGANTSTTPTFAPDGLAAKTLVKENLAAFAAGDIAGAGHEVEGFYNATADKVVILNPINREIGTWTPALGGTATYTVQSGRYIKIGKLVYIRGKITVNAIGTGNTSTVSGLPFQSLGGTFETAGSVGYFANIATAATFLAFAISNGANSFPITGIAAAGVSMSSGFVTFQNGTDLIFSATYEAA